MNVNVFDVIDWDVFVYEVVMMMVNSCTALRLLVDNDAREGDTIVVNVVILGVGWVLL